ncbi:MAG: hypothetical protein AAFU58_05310, partial [Pseudomonadota bacterium]
RGSVMKISSRPTDNRAVSRRTSPAEDTANSVNDPATRTRSLTATTTGEVRRLTARLSVGREEIFITLPRSVPKTTPRLRQQKGGAGDH